MGGSPTTTQTSQQQSTTTPWAPAAPLLSGILDRLGGSLDNSGLSPQESSALAQLSANAQAGNPYAPAIGNVASTLLAGGGPDRGGTLADAYAGLRSELGPWANGAMTDPASNPVLARELAAMQGDVTNSVNQQFAAAGRDLSPDNTRALARGIAQGAAPLFADAQRQGLDAASTLFNAGSSTAAGLSGLDQARLADERSGLDAANSALAAQSWGPSQLLALAQQQYGIPLQNLSQIAGIADPLAGQFATTNSNGTATTQTQVPMWQQILGAALAAAGTAAKFTTSDARVKENKQRIGALLDGTPVYAFNFIGDPATRIGLIAQDIEKRRPDAVMNEDGVKSVDYDKATELSGILGRLFAAQ